MMSHLLSLGGKRLRPALLLLARGDGEADEVGLAAAAAIEVIHISSLHHDDVMDRGETRRGAQSVNRRWGNGAATLSGTLLYARAHTSLRAAGDEAVRLAAVATSRLCAGQLRESENAFNQALSIEEHFAALDEKTASLFELAVELGAMMGGRPRRESKALGRFARRLGRAFQLRDDMLDWSGSPGRLGKATRTDLHSGIYNLPVLLALAARDAGAVRLEALLQKRALSDGDAAEVSLLVEPQLARVEDYVRAEAAAAIAALGPLPGGARRRSLERLVEFSVGRTH